MTPSELKKVTAAAVEVAAALLSREDNEDRTAEELAEELANSVTESIISAYDKIQAEKYNMIVLGHFRLDDDTSYVAAVGPLSTRATARARDIGQRFAWDYKTRKGTGQFVLVPLVRNPNEAWDDARLAQLLEYEGEMGSVTPGTETSYEPMRFDLPDSVRARISAEWTPDPEVLARTSAPACRCGRRTEVWIAEGGGTDDGVCPRHPEGREGDS